MTHLLQLVIGLLACLAGASALPALFPRENITTYKYYAQVRTETFEIPSFASEFVISGNIHVTPENSDRNLKNAFYVSLDVSHGVRNGEVKSTGKIAEDKLQPIPDAAKALKDPFVAVFDDNGKVKGLIVNKNEAGWSRNMKKSIASMLQLDLSSMNLQTPIERHNFTTNESTIYGECTVEYDVKGEPEHGEKTFRVVKWMDPSKCTKFDQYTFNPDEPMDYVEKMDNFGASGEKVIYIENNGENLLIKKLETYGLMNYSPWKDGSDVHSVIVNQSMVFESSAPVGSITLPTLNMNETVLLNDVTFQRPQSKYADKANVDLTYGRHVVNAEALITELIEMLGEAADYMNEDHSEITEPEIKHGQTINRILDTMGLMDIPSLEEVVKRITFGTSQKDVSIRKTFLQMLPYVGTDATCVFIINMIRDGKVPNMIAISIVSKLPFHVRAPTGKLLVELEGLTSFGDDVSRGIQKAGVLAFATLIYKAHRYQKYHETLNPELVSKYVNQYFGHVMNETNSFETRLLYIEAMRNIGIGDVFKLLKPIVSGKVVLSVKPQYLRLRAMHAFERHNLDSDEMDELFWPILEDKEVPLESRAAAFMILFKLPPKMERFMKLLVYMENEKDEHLYKFSYVTMLAFANASGSSMGPLKEMARSMLLDIRVRRPAENLQTDVKRIDYENEEFGFGESWTVGYAADQHTGVPFIAKLEYSAAHYQMPVKQLTFFLRVEGFDDIPGTVSWDTSLEDLDVPIEKIENLLKKASEDMPGKKPIHVEFAVMSQGRFIMSEYFDEETLPESIGMYITSLFASIAEEMPTWQDVMFDKLYTKQVSNELGLPTIFETKIPRMMSAHQNISSRYRDLRLDIGAKSWSHGYQTIEVYNPIIDAWHALRRVSAVDSSLPSSMSIKIPEHNKGFTLTLPRLPATNYSVSYSRAHYKNYVMVIGVGKDVLEPSCPTCNLTVIASKGVEDDEIKTLLDLDSMETGLHISVGQYDCDRNYTSGSDPNILNKVFENDGVTSWYYNVALGLMALREHYLSALSTSKIRGCGYLAMAEPTQMYPTSEIDINAYIDGSTALPKKLTLPPAMDIDFNVSVVARGVTTEDIIQSWTMTGSWNSTEGYYQNDLQLDITGSYAENEKDLKICIDAHKTYPPALNDPLNRTVDPDRKTIGEIKVLIGTTVTEDCPTEGLSLSIKEEGKMSAEQKEALEHGQIHDECQKDVENPLYMYAESSVVPRTAACVKEALLRTTLREYSYDVVYQNVPEHLLDMAARVEDQLSSLVAPNSTTLPAHTEPGNAKISVEFPLNNKDFILNVRTPNHETKYTHVSSDADEDWTPVLDNTYFSSDLLDDILDQDTKFCSIYPEILRNADRGTSSYTVSGQWTLVTGDHKNHLFSVFVKRIEPKKLGLLVTVTNHTIEVIPTDTNPTVTVDGNAVSYENGLVVPEKEDEDEDDPLAFRITWSPNPKRFRMETTFPALDIEWTERSVSLVMSSTLQGKVTGLCGHLDGTHRERIAKVYTLDE